MVVVALSVHSLFEGMAIGLEESSSGVWTLMLAISIHAVPIVFCVGTDMISSGLKKVDTPRPSTQLTNSLYILDLVILKLCSE